LLCLSLFCRCGAQLGGDLGSSSQALDGILGFGQANSSMLSQLSAAGKVQKIFSHCLDTVHGGGIYAIGNVVQPKVKTTPLVRGLYVTLPLLVCFLIKSCSLPYCIIPCHGLSRTTLQSLLVHTFSSAKKRRKEKKSSFHESIDSLNI
jgi:hypothetical protein